MALSRKPTRGLRRGQVGLLRNPFSMLRSENKEKRRSVTLASLLIADCRLLIANLLIVEGEVSSQPSGCKELPSTLNSADGYTAPVIFLAIQNNPSSKMRSPAQSGCAHIRVRCTVGSGSGRAAR